MSKSHLKMILGITMDFNLDQRRLMGGDLLVTNLFVLSILEDKCGLCIILKSHNLTNTAECTEVL